jgi:hypothetical protein
MPTIKPKRQRVYEAEQAKDASLLAKLEKSVADTNSAHALSRLAGAIDTCHKRMEVRRCAFFNVESDAKEDFGVPAANCWKPGEFNELFPNYRDQPERLDAMEAERAAALKAERAALVEAGDTKALALWDKRYGMTTMRFREDQKPNSRGR